jgi:hypothetical protein
MMCAHPRATSLRSMFERYEEFRLFLEYHLMFIYRPTVLHKILKTLGCYIRLYVQFSDIFPLIFRQYFIHVQVLGFLVYVTDYYKVQILKLQFLIPTLLWALSTVWEPTSYFKWTKFRVLV